jgi:hypothetical protein
MNHLEQLVAEWLQYNDYVVRVSVQVGPRPNGGFKGELDVVGIHVTRQHLIHVECSLDALSRTERERKFAAKFERGREFITTVFKGLPVPDELDQVIVLQFPNAGVRAVGGARLVSVRELIHEIFAGLKGTSPTSGAVPSNLPLLRTLQVAADAVAKGAPTEYRMIQPTEISD